MSSKLFIFESLTGVSINNHFMQRYFWFIETFSNTGGKTKHHILPQADFPHFSNFKEHPWNQSLLTDRQHFVAHWLLSKAMGGSQAYAFWAMLNKNSEKTTSRTYEKARQLFCETISKDAERSSKISDSMKGVSKSTVHTQKMIETKNEPVWKSTVGQLATQKRMEKMDYAEVGQKGSQTKLSKEWREENLEQWSRRISEATAGKPKPAMSLSRKEKNNRPIVKTIRELAKQKNTPLGTNWWSKSDEALQELLDSLQSVD